MNESFTQFELEQADTYSQYLLHSKAEVLAVLRSILQKGALVTVHFDEGRFFFLTSMIALLPDSSEFLLDLGSNDEANSRAARSSKLIFTTTVDKVKIQFLMDELRRVDYQGHTVFASDVPDELLRLQRREFFRLSTPVAHPIRMATTLESDGRAIDLALLDISGGGVGLMVPLDIASLLEKGQMLENCRIVLPMEGLLSVTLCVRNQFDVTTRSGARYIRVGCEFIGLSAARLSAVQRYIIQVEREQKARFS